jgi:hypothetical protein
MALYPIKQLQDQNRVPFFPFNTLESVLVNGTDKNLADVLADIYTKEEINTMFATELSQFDIYSSYSDLPETARVGAVAVVATNDASNMYMYYEDAWCPLTQKGDTGPQGPAGPQGAQGIQGVQGPAGQDGTDGIDGQDGFSPVANVSKTGHTATISITDSNGTTTAYVYDGENSGTHVHLLKLTNNSPEQDPDNIAAAQDILTDMSTNHPFIVILQIYDRYQNTFVANIILEPDSTNSENYVEFKGYYKTELYYADGYDMPDSVFTEYAYGVVFIPDTLGQVESITFTVNNTTHNLLETNVDYDTEYTPQYDGAPITKHYFETNLDVYDSAEIIVGRWIDGKDIYRTTIEMQPDSTNYDETVFPYGYVDTVVRIYGVFITETQDEIEHQPLPYVNVNSTYNKSINYLKTKDPNGSDYIKMKTNSNPAGGTAYITIEYTLATNN